MMNQTIIGRIHNGHVLGVAAFLAPPLSVFAPLGFAPLFIVTAIAALVTRRLGAGAWPSAPLPFSILLVAILGWSLLSLGWAIETGVAFQALWRLALIFVGGVVIVDAARHLMPEERDIFDRLICAGFLLGLALMALERFAHGPLFHLFNTSPPDEDFPLAVLNRGATVLALMIWPVAIAIWQRSSTAAIALWLVTFALLLTLPSGAAIAAMAVGGVAFFCDLRRSAIRLRDWRGRDWRGDPAKPSDAGPPAFARKFQESGIDHINFAAFGLSPHPDMEFRRQAYCRTAYSRLGAERFARHAGARRAFGQVRTGPTASPA